MNDQAKGVVVPGNVTGLVHGRSCGNCKWCPGPPAAVPCNWRFGMYTGDKHPPRSKVVMHALNPATVGYPVVVAQPINPGQPIPRDTMAWLVIMSLKLPVVLLDAAAHRGGVIRAILTQDQTLREEVAAKLNFLLPPPGHKEPEFRGLVDAQGNPLEYDATTDPAPEMEQGL